jgi:hypothetical protein
MKRAHFASILVLGLSALAIDARADLEILGVYGIPVSASDASCWGTLVGGNTFGIRINNCAATPWEPYKTIYYPLLYQSTSASTWHAEIRASSGVGCGVFAEPDDGGVYPVGSGYNWSVGTSTAINVWVTTTYTAAYVHCQVPQGGYIVSVKWWLT